MPSISLTSQAKNSSTKIGIRHDVTSMTARASIKRFRTVLSCPTAAVAAPVMPSVTLEKRPERPLFSPSSVPPEVADWISSVVCSAFAMVSSIEARYVSSIMLETLTPAGMANAMASAKSSKCHASFPSAARSFSEKSAAMPSAQAAGIRIVNDT